MAELNDVFKALADPSRRRILDIVRDHPGINVNELTEHFPFSRFATMKHLRILEEAKLILGKREWKEKRLYLNAVPIQMIHERWISKYEAKLASSLTKLKHQTENE